MKKIYLFLSILLCLPTLCRADGDQPDVRRDYQALMTKQLWEIQDYLIEVLRVAERGYQIYPECNNISRYYTPKDRQRLTDYLNSGKQEEDVTGGYWADTGDVILSHETINKLVMQYSNCIHRYIWVSDTDLASMAFGAFGQSSYMAGTIYNQWPGRARNLMSKEYSDGNVRHTVKWWDEDVMDRPECTGPEILQTDSKHERKRKAREIREHTCLYPRGFQEYKIHWEWGPDEEVMTVFYDDPSRNIHQVSRYSMLKNTDTGFYKFDHWTAVYNYNEYYAWLNQKQQDIKDGMYPVTIDPAMLCDSDAQCLEMIKQDNPDATDLEKYRSMQRFPRKIQFYKVQPFIDSGDNAQQGDKKEN